MTKPRRDLLLLVAAAVVPVGGGVLLHREHLRVERSLHAALARDLPLAPHVEQPAAAPPPPPAAMAAPAPRSSERPFAYGDHFAFVQVYDGEPHIVLDPKALPSWRAAEGRIETPTRAVAAVRDEHLPPSVRSQELRRVRLFDRHGFVGEVEVGLPHLVAEVSGDLFGLEYGERLNEAWDDPAKLAALADDEGAIESMFEHGRVLLVAPLEPEARIDASGPLWARSVDLPMPVALRPVSPPAPLANAAKAHLLQQDEFSAVREDAGPSASQQLASFVESEGWATPDGTVVFVTATTRGDLWDGCGGLYTSAWTAMQDGIGRPGRLETFGRAPTAVFDLDGDGLYEGILPSDLGEPSQLLHATPRDWTSLAELDPVPFFGCPC